MKRVFLLSILFAVLFTSCNMGMLGQYSDYYYYAPNKNTGGASGGDSGPGEDIEIPDIDVDPEKDPFIKGEWNKPDYKFDGTKFETWLLKVSFDGSNIPEYGFFEDETQWTESHVKEGYPEVSFNADNRGWTAQGITMKPLTIYRYNHKNPLVAADGAYNTSDRLDRFFFYRIIGAAKVAGIGANLDQYLIAVDSYSKFVFAYAKVTSTESVMGNAVPNGFGPVENFGENRFFYEYDPIGYVKESGELVLYQEYRDAMLATKSIGFFPAIKDPSRPMASEEGPGTSPYYVDSVENIDPEALKDMFKGKTYSIRDVNNSLILYTYAISEDGNTLTITQTHYYDGVMDEPQVFTNPEVVGSSSLKFGEKTVVGLDKTDTGFAKLKDGDTELELLLNYKDLGPDFLSRVQNEVNFASPNSGDTYTFKNNGKTLIMNGEEYTYVSGVSEVNNRAIYTKKIWGLPWYYGVELSVKDSLPDQVVKITDGGAWGATNWGSLGWEAYRGEEVTASFTKNVAGKSYVIRDGLGLYTYQFNEYGGQAVLKREIWNTEGSTEVEDQALHFVSQESPTKATFAYASSTPENLQTVTLELQETNKYLWVADKKYTIKSDFQDPGPEFLLRVQNEVTFVSSSGDSYTFKNNGKTLIMNGDEYTYVSGVSGVNNRAIYTKYMALINYRYGIELNANDMGQDQLVKMTDGAWSDGTIIWSTLGWEATRQP